MSQAEPRESATKPRQRIMSIQVCRPQDACKEEVTESFPFALIRRTILRMWNEDPRARWAPDCCIVAALIQDGSIDDQYME